MLLPTRLASLAVAALLVVAAAADAATFYFPETEPASEHKPVAAQLEALGITRFTPPTNHAGDLWSLVASHHSEIDLVWSAHAEAPPLDKLTFATPFRPKINHVPGSDARLTDNDAFHQHIRDSQRKKDLFLFNFVPSHHVLPRDQAEMPKVFAETAKRVENNLKREDDAFIYQRFLVREQPANGNEESLTAASMITNNDELLAAINAHPQGKSVEVTQYIEPYLIDGHKFQLGFYVVVASVDPLRIYSYGHPQIRIAKTAYPTRLKKDTDKSAYNFNDYIAPWDFPDLQKLYYEYPSTDRTGTNAWTVLKRYMLLHGLDTTRLQKEIDAAIVTSIVSSRGYFQAKIRKFGRSAPAPGDEHKDHTELDESFFELMRFDFEVEDLGKPWLMRIHSNPSMAPHTTVFGSDEAVKKSLLFDLFNLVGVHPQAKPAFDEVFVHADNKFCTAKCQDDVTRTWDATCWSCPGGFAPYVARRLFDAKNEYARRGAFKLVYPSMDQDFTKVLDNPMSEYDLAFTRYIKSLSTAYADTAPQDVSVYNHVLVCTHREHCSSHGDCVNGKCVCDDEYEGATCYIPKDLDREKSLIEERAAADKRAKESWMGNLWKRVPVPAPMEAASVAERVKHDNKAPAKPQQLSQPSDGGVSGGTIFGLLFVGTFAYGGYQVYVSKYGAGGSNKSN